MWILHWGKYSIPGETYYQDNPPIQKYRKFHLQKLEVFR